MDTSLSINRIVEQVLCKFHLLLYVKHIMHKPKKGNFRFWVAYESLATVK